MYIDTVGDSKRYQQKLQKIFPKLDITVKPKADALFPIVSAASIAAKVTRDRTLQTWKFREIVLTSTDFGSGYPSDEHTQKWLKKNVDKVFGFPSLVRFSWKPVHLILAKVGVPVRWSEFDDYDHLMDLDDEGGRPKSPALRRRASTGSIGTQSSGKQQRLNFSTRFRFFVDNNMEIVEDF